MNRAVVVIPGPETVIWWGVHVPVLAAAFGIAGREPVRLSLGGRPLLTFTERRTEFDKANAAGVSTLGYVAIGAGVALVVGALLFKDALDDASE